mmetsp:Transcript_42485/g.48271  ORF Transcript_42485/g.48271 Transcript_42485/m.48271 type:complete len:177 (-) Transcript_42485:332-862(-)
MMEGCDSTKIETVGDSPTDQLNDIFCCFINIPYNRILPEHQKSSKTDTSSIALTNNDIYSKSEFPTPSIDDSTGLICYGKHEVDFLSFRFLFQRSSVKMVSCYEYYSHALACIATSSRECGLFTTSLDTLWYVYSYIYSQLSSNATTIMFLLFFVAVLLMPTTDTPPTSTTVPNIR